MRKGTISDPLHVLITGGTGFIGKAIARRLLADDALQLEGQPRREIERITLFDAAEGEGVPKDPRVQVRIGDIADSAAVASVVKDAELIWHLAAVVSSEAEANFALGMRVNLYGLLNLLDASRAGGISPRLVYASGFAVFGGELPATVTDATAPTPKSSYGTQKAIGELLVADFSRRGFIDGRTVRLPTIAVRPGRPNKAASTFVSSIIREPLNGQRAVCPVRADTQLYISSPRRAVESMLLAMTLSNETIGSERTIPLPGIKVSVAGMIAALERAAGKSAADLICWEPDAAVQRIVDSWPVDVQAERAARLGFRADSNFDQIVQAHIEDENIQMCGAAGGL